jgi:hypothetical protein
MEAQPTDPAPSQPTIIKATELRDGSPAELMDLFRKGGAPTSLAPLEGDPCGVGIGLNVWSGSWFDRWLRKRAALPRFAWHGKSFRMKSETEGWGFNRVGRGPLVTVFPFKTGLGPSVLDGGPCVIIDYNVPRNPWWERLTYDELREVGPGVFLGITTLRLFGRRPVLLWFAVDTTVPEDWAAA